MHSCNLLCIVICKLFALEIFKQKIPIVDTVWSLLFTAFNSKLMCCWLTTSLIMRQSVWNLMTNSTNLGLCLSTSSQVNSYIILFPAESTSPHYGHSEQEEKGKWCMFVESVESDTCFKWLKFLFLNVLPVRCFVVFTDGRVGLFCQNHHQVDSFVVLTEMSW